MNEPTLSSQAPLRANGSGPLPATLEDQEKEMIEAALCYKSRSNTKPNFSRRARVLVGGPRG
jgi:hypothetical protein